MLVNNLDIGRAELRPHETDPKLVVHPNRVLPCTVALQGLQAVVGGRLEVAKRDRCVEHRDLPLDDPLDVSEAARRPPSVDGSRLAAPERPDHGYSMTLVRYTSNVQQDRARITASVRFLGGPRSAPGRYDLPQAPAILVIATGRDAVARGSR